MSATPGRELRSNSLFGILRLLLDSSLGGSKEIPIYKGLQEVLVNYL